MKADRFTVTPGGGIFKSSADPNIRIYFPVNAVDNPMDIVLQIEKVDQEALLSAKLRSRTVDNILAMGHIIHVWQSVNVNFNEQVALTIPAPPTPQRGKLHVITYRDDNTCAPCSSGYRIINGYMTINAWHFSGKGAVLTRTKCKYKACKSVETLLRSFYI
ncbi:uncharacterized protein LOC135502736 [Lineus longissimus]|uniref:uncharacterized protein LOC135502736 n=1 Tax=Lineus longissimus TaxID=88925 RepID=UPI00315C69BA